MTAGDVASALVERGLDQGEHAAATALFQRVLAVLGGTSDAHLWWVPGRLEVFGKHTDYAGGRTLVCALPRGFALAARRRNDHRVVVTDARHDESLAIDLDAVTPPRRGWGHYVEVTARRLTRNFPGAAIGADLVFASNLPRASGMSSSSALVVGVAAALMRIGALQQRAEWTTNIHDTLDLAGYCACLENGMTFGSLEGDTGVGTHGGSEDHAAILTGTASMLSAFAFVPMRHLQNVHVPDEWQFVLSPCGVPSEKTGSAQEKYNRLSEGTRRLLDLWNAAAETSAASLGAALTSTSTARERLEELIDRSALPGWPPSALRARLDHFVREDARVAQAIEALTRADVATMTDVAHASQRDAETLLGNQIPATIGLAAAARRGGAFAASSFGAGFGGSVWALVERNAAPGFAARWRPEAFTAQPGPGMVEVETAPTKSEH